MSPDFGPDSGLISVQCFGNDNGSHRRPRIIAAGAFSLAREAMSPDVQRVLGELWRRLARP